MTSSIGTTLGVYVYMSMYITYEPGLWYQQLVSSLYVSSAGSVCGLHKWITMDMYWDLSKSNILESMLTFILDIPKEHSAHDAAPFDV